MPANRRALRAVGPLPLAKFWEPKPAPPKRRKLPPLADRGTSRRRNTPIPTHELPTPEQVREALDYCPKTGVFTWRHRAEMSAQWNGRHAGKIAGSPCARGYLYFGMGGRLFLAHRLAWLITHGDWPPEQRQVDHANGIPSDNRLANLRLATRGQNGCNRGAPRNNTSGFKGVSWTKWGWRSYISVGGRQIHLGYYPTPEEAYAAYCRAAREYHGEFAHVGTRQLATASKKRTRPRAVMPAQIDLFALAA